MTVPAGSGTALPPIRVYTVNSASEAMGSIHDDDKAREMGYAGGFVPGVTVLGYMLRLMRESYGADWLAGGTFNGRLRRPTYAGVEVTVEGTVVEPPSPENGERVTVDLRVLDPDGAVTATGTASCRVGRDG
jgi:acyl dehydratase